MNLLKSGKLLLKSRNIRFNRELVDISRINKAEKNGERKKLGVESAVSKFAMFSTY